MPEFSAMMMAKDEWSAEEELQLFHAMEGLRPVGINKHFYMSCIAERLSKSLNREMPSDIIWRHLSTMYKLKELDDLEGLPFPNEEREFCLPEQDYATFVNKKTIGANANEENTDTPASTGATVPAAAIDSNSKSTKLPVAQSKDTEKKMPAKLSDLPKRPAKRTRGSMSNESISPSTTPPPMQSSKRRRI
ncbi:PREDICTED: MRG/MORF4L-binding protein [Drosophila arizonae]|uniref:MRG/MORF4L-binding protein n=1 Tax=Drosophila arizonae TaxID=7263 RepID=A0ABM1PDI4_DROAR|nr:PREDICTED: MRG/MORF4L-binding protein [Drosophila arizonae]